MTVGNEQHEAVDFNLIKPSDLLEKDNFSFTAVNYMDVDCIEIKQDSGQKRGEGKQQKSS